jgi:hypothetical protein
MEKIGNGQLKLDPDADDKKYMRGATSPRQNALEEVETINSHSF